MKLSYSGLANFMCFLDIPAREYWSRFLKRPIFFVRVQMLQVYILFLKVMPAFLHKKAMQNPRLLDHEKQRELFFWNNTEQQKKLFRILREATFTLFLQSTFQAKER